MHFDVNEQICKEILDFYGIESTTVVSIEESSEVIKELTKMLRGRGVKEHLEEEIADVIITLKEICMIYNLNTENIQKQIKFKQNREYKRIKGE